MRIVITPIMLGCAVLLGGSASKAETPESKQPPSELTIPYVATRHDIVRDMLWLANVGKADVVYDLGSGDGRIVIAAVRDFGARRAVGIEINPQRVRESNENARKASVADRVKFIQGDLFTNDFSQASVVTLYLGDSPNQELRAKLVSALRPGARVVSHQFSMGEWPPDKVLQVRTRYLGMYAVFGTPFVNNPRVPDYSPRHGLGPDKGSAVSMWIVPAPVAGVWRGEVSEPTSEGELRLRLQQRLGDVTGSFQLQNAQTNVEGTIRLDLWGNHLRFECYPTGMSYRELRLMFDGSVEGDTLRGRLAVFRPDEVSEYRWEGRRESTDLTGNWEWTGPTGSRRVQLRIERREGRLTATYTDRQRQLAVTDFYDFGGGFYFTLLIGREPAAGGFHSIRMDEDCGWLIGEGVPGGNFMSGTIEFHPCSGRSDKTAGTQDRPQEWKPKRIIP